MKKFLATLCTGFLLLCLLAGCGSKSDSVTIAVPNDTTNEARALLLLQDNGYITLKDGAGITATVNDIAENPLQYHLQGGRSGPAAQRPARTSTTPSSIPTTRIDADLEPDVTDSLLMEGSSSAYGNILAVKEGNEETDKTKAL